MMKKSSSARRIPRKIGTDDDEQSSDLPQTLPTSSLKRPSIGAKKHSQPRRLGASVDDADEDAEQGVRTPKRSALSRIAIQRSTGQRSSFLANELVSNDDVEETGPTYSASDLQALKDSTPATPSEFPSQDGLALQLNDKFGTSLEKYGQSSAIPSAAEISEKKARRARMAMEQQAEEYISLDPDDPGLEEDDDGNVMRDMDGRLVLREKDRYGIQESRLVRDDEDVMEGFDEFTGEAGSRIAMGSSAKGPDRQARKDDISRQIAQAEADSDGDLDDDDKRRNAAFEAVQTRHGAFSTDQADKYDKYAAYRAKIPATITPIPTLDVVIKRFKASITDLETQKMQKEAELVHLSQEKLKLGDEEVRVQRQLKEVAEKYRQIRIEKGLLPKDADTSLQANDGVIEHAVNGNSTTSDQEDEDDTNNTHTGLGAVTQAVDSNSREESEDDVPRMGIGLGSSASDMSWLPASTSGQ